MKTSTNSTRPIHQMRLLRTIQVAMIFIAAGGALFVIAGMANVHRMRELRAKGNTVEALIVNSRVEKAANGHETYILLTQYRPENHPKIDKEFRVDESDFRMSREHGTIPVTYLPHDPDVSAVGTRFGFDKKPMVFGSVVFVISLLSMLFVQCLYGRTKQLAHLMDIAQRTPRRAPGDL